MLECLTSDYKDYSMWLGLQGYTSAIAYLYVMFRGIIVSLMCLFFRHPMWKKRENFHSCLLLILVMEYVYFRHFMTCIGETINW